MKEQTYCSKDAQPGAEPPATAALPEERRPRLRIALEAGRQVRAIECHNPLSAKLGEEARGKSGDGFDALWISGFANAASLALPDAELSHFERRIEALGAITNATCLPLIVDADTGGDEQAFAILARRLEMLGASALVVEDKTGVKRTSLAEGAAHELEDPEVFARKLSAAKAALGTGDTLMFARIESLIAGVERGDSLRRAEIYLQSAADGLVIHSKDRSGGEIAWFLKEYAALQRRLQIVKPIAVIPTAYPQFSAADLRAQGASIVIYGNHMIRSAFKAMKAAARSILDHDRALEADEELCAPVSELLAFTDNAAPRAKSRS